MLVKWKHGRHVGEMFLYFLPRRRQILKYFALILAVFIIVRLFSKSETPSEEPGLPILVAQRGNDQYFRAKPPLNLETYSKQHTDMQWEMRKQASSSTSEVTYGKLNVHIWGEICGYDLNSLKNHVLFPKYPQRRFYTHTTGFTHGIGNNDFGERIFGFLLPKSTGLYSFRILGKSMEVWIGKNADPLSAELVYQNSLSPNSVGKFELKLVAKNKYYIEILHKKDNQDDDDFALKWKVPGSSHFAEISGSDISVKLLDAYLRNGEVDSNESNLEIPTIHRKIRFPILNEQEQQRNDLFKLPLIPDKVVKNVLTSCDYKPSYIVDHTLTNYKGVWETHYSSLYPIDETNVTRGGWVCLGNDGLKEREAVQIVEEYIKSLDKKDSG